MAFSAALSKQERIKPQKRQMEPVFYEMLVTRKRQEMEMKLVIRDLIVYFVYVIIIFLIRYDIGICKTAADLTGHELSP